MNRTPRNLAECRFTTGYGIAHMSAQPTRTERVLGVLQFAPQCLYFSTHCGLNHFIAGAARMVHCGQTIFP